MDSLKAKPLARPMLINYIKESEKHNHLKSCTICWCVLRIPVLNTFYQFSRLMDLNRFS